jgi:hypothetical protein
VRPAGWRDHDGDAGSVDSGPADGCNPSDGGSILALTPCDGSAVGTSGHVTVQASVSTIIDLCVVVRDLSGNVTAPVPNEVVTFQFVTAATGTSFPANQPALVTTNGQGIAEIQLQVGVAAGTTTVIASAANGALLFFDVEAS